MNIENFMLVSSLMTHPIESFVLPRKKKAKKTKKCVARIAKENRAKKARKNQRK